MIESPMSFGTLNYLVLTVYVAGMLAVGWWYAGRQTTLQHYFLAGRNLPWIAVAMSMYASVTSAMTFMGLPGQAYSQNISLIIVSLMSPVIAPVLIFLIYPLYRRLRITTSYEYIALRFGSPARLAVSALFVLARLSWLGTVIYAPALALHVTTGIPQPVAIGIIGLLATVYCVMGGLSAVVWTDVPQFIIMIGGAVWMAVLLCGLVPDGVAGILHEGHVTDKLMVFDWSFKLGEMTALGVSIAYVFILIQDYGVDQVSVQRLMSIKSDRGVTRAILFNALTDFIIIGLLLFIGLGLFVYYQVHSQSLPVDFRADRVLPWFILHELPPGVSGLLIAALFAAAMSSVDSGLNSLTTVIINDMIAPFRKSGAGGIASVTGARWMTAGLGLTASLVALFFYPRIGGILKTFYTYMGLFSAPVLALFLLGMISTRAHARGWFAATAVSIITILVIQHQGWLHEIHFFPLSTMITLMLGYVFSLWIPAGAGTNPNFTWQKVLRS